MEGSYKIQIQGHRGGFKPDNIIPTFQKSVENQLEAVELDVWHSKDGVIVVCHGGDDGNLKDYGLPEEFIYEWDFDRLQTLDAGEGAKIPKLEEVFKTFDGKVFVNVQKIHLYFMKITLYIKLIEVKGPRTAELKPKYDCDLVISGVLELVDKYDMHGKYLFSSFNYDVLAAAERARERRRDTHPRFDVIYKLKIFEIQINFSFQKFILLYLYNYENEPLPSADEYTSRGDGINISANHITDEVVANIKSKGMKLGVWIRAKDFTETEEFYENMFKFRVDFICADYPLKAMEARSRYLQSIERVQQ